jgi:hypothetical protein
MNWATTHSALYDAGEVDTLWTSPRGRPVFAANLPVPRLEPALLIAWTRTCSARCLDSEVLCPLPGLEHDLSAAWTQTCSVRYRELSLLCPLLGLEVALPAAWTPSCSAAAWTRTASTRCSFLLGP